MNEPPVRNPEPFIFYPMAPLSFDIVEEGNMLLIFSDGIVDDDFCSMLLHRCSEAGDTVEEILLDLRDATVLDSSLDALKAIEGFARARGLFLGITNATAALKRDLDYPGCCIEWLD